MLRLFDYKCPKCKLVEERLSEIKDDAIEIQFCNECKKQMDRMPSMFKINMGPVPIGGHFDENLDCYIESNSHRKRVMREQGVTEIGATPKLEDQAWV